jgi:Fe-S-cluster containining protein
MTIGAALPLIDAPAALPQPTVQKLAALLPLAQHRLARPSGWWTWLRLRRQFSLSPVRPHQLQLRLPSPHQQPDCAGCTSICCTGPDALVSLRLQDLARLQDIGQLHEHTITYERPTEVRNALWARREADGSVFHQAFPHLRRDNTGTCGFLTDDRQCGVYPHWPLSCRRYPYALDLQLRVVFYAKGCQSYADSSVANSLSSRRLLTAVCDAYNERIHDIMRLAACGEELAELGLLRFVKTAALSFPVRSLPDR